jgi:cyclopropane fatty-acyl-phospholipid synthase-like methyltransferase
MAASAGHRLTLDPMGKYSNAFFSETTNMVSEKKAFEYFPIGSNVNLCPAVAAILDFRSA